MQFIQSINTSSIGRWQFDHSLKERFMANLLMAGNLQKMGCVVKPRYRSLQTGIKRLLKR
jgi:hypothetical protein